MLFVCLSVFVCVYQQDYCKSDQPSLIKLDVMIGPAIGRNQLIFGGDLVSDTDSRSFFTFFSIAE